jgi:hypothetical protein
MLVVTTFCTAGNGNVSVCLCAIWGGIWTLAVRILDAAILLLGIWGSAACRLLPACGFPISCAAGLHLVLESQCPAPQADMPVLITALSSDYGRHPVCDCIVRVVRMSTSQRCVRSRRAVGLMAAMDASTASSCSSPSRSTCRAANEGGEHVAAAAPLPTHQMMITDHQSWDIGMPDCHLIQQDDV